VDTPLNRGNPNRIFVLKPERAAQIMIGAVADGRRHVIYPWQMKPLFHLARALPSGLYRRVAARTRHLSRPTPRAEAPGG
jgi:hypothetical protein